MEQVNKKNFAYASIDNNACAFAEGGTLEYAVTFHQDALTPGNAFIVDIYAADDSSHPKGHAGWWEYALEGNSQVMVQLKLVEGKIKANFDGKDAEQFWNNPDFEASNRELTMRLVVREWRSSAVLYNDPVPLYPDKESMASGQHLDVWQSAMPVEPNSIPPRWFVWPRPITIRLVFGSMLSTGAVNFCSQVVEVLRSNNMPCEVYAESYSAIQRRKLKPAAYLAHEAKRTDLIFFVYAEGGDLLPLVAELKCKKLLYHMHLPDYRRFQAFDAELARRLQLAECQIEELFKFDGICYESEYTRDKVTNQLHNVAHNEQMKGVHIPPSLGVFPPCLWRASWQDIEEEACAVPTPFILSLGSFRPDKHHEHTLKIFAEIAKKDSTLTLVIVGWPSINGYWDYLNFLHQHTYADISERIIFLQSCSKGQLLYLYRHAAAFITASSYEGYSNSVAEAIDFNLPVIARQTCSMQQLLGCSGLQYSENMPMESIAEDVVLYIENKSLDFFHTSKLDFYNKIEKLLPINMFFKVLNRTLKEIMSGAV